MFPKCLGVENRFLKWLFKFCEHSRWKSKGKYPRYRTAQRMASISKLVFSEIFGGPRGDPQKKKSAEAIFFFRPKIENLGPNKHSGCRSKAPTVTPAVSNMDILMSVRILAIF